MKFHKVVFFASCIASIPIAYAGEDPEELLLNMKSAWKKVYDFQAEMTKQELLENKLSKEETILVKVKVNPEKKTVFSKCEPGKIDKNCDPDELDKFNYIYIKYLTAPYKNREAIYRGPEGTMIATNGKFPNLTVKLDPIGRTAMEDQHHPIYHISIGHTVREVLGQVKLAQVRGELKSITNNGSDVIDGRTCTKIEIKFSTTAGSEIQGQKGDSWFSLAKLYYNDYYLLIHNNNGKKPNKDKIWAPTYYGSRMELCIDDMVGIPIKITTWDHKGALYEVYTFKKFQVNKNLEDIEFDRDNENYDFN